jgi:hypothetical protein
MLDAHQKAEFQCQEGEHWSSFDNNIRSDLVYRSELYEDIYVSFEA